MLYLQQDIREWNYLNYCSYERNLLFFPLYIPDGDENFAHTCRILWEKKIVQAKNCTILPIGT